MIFVGSFLLSYSVHKIHIWTHRFSRGGDELKFDLKAERIALEAKSHNVYTPSQVARNGEQSKEHHQLQSDTSHKFKHPVQGQLDRKLKAAIGLKVTYFCALSSTHGWLQRKVADIDFHETILEETKGIEVHFLPHIILRERKDRLPTPYTGPSFGWVKPQHAATHPSNCRGSRVTEIAT